jgi:hypothetical protein
MVRRYDVNFPAKRASFNKDGSAVIACADFDIQVGLEHVATPPGWAILEAIISLLQMLPWPTLCSTSILTCETCSAVLTCLQITWILMLLLG